MAARTAGGLAYETRGCGPPVLLVHAGIADRTMWEPQWETWPDRVTLIRYDQRGFGDSPDPDGPWSEHRDALAVLDAAGAGRAAIVGASRGGTIALDLALAAPGRVAALVVIGSRPSGHPQDPGLAAAHRRVEAAYERGGVEAANEVELEVWADGIGREPAAVDPGFRGRVAEMNRAALRREEARERAGLAIEPASLEPPAGERLGEVAVPALVLIGEHDQPGVRAGCETIAGGVAGAEIAEIAGAAHLPSLERPREFDRVTLAFVERRRLGSEPG